MNMIQGAILSSFNFFTFCAKKTVRHNCYPYLTAFFFSIPL